MLLSYAVVRLYKAIIYSMASENDQVCRFFSLRLFLRYMFYIFERHFHIRNQNKHCQWSYIAQLNFTKSDVSYISSPLAILCQYTTLYSYFMPVCSIVKLLPLSAVDDLMHFCTRPSASCNSASGRPRHLGVIV